MSGYKVTGLVVHRLHYGADPEKNTDAWKAYAKTGQSPDKWAREMEMDPRAGALTAVFRESYKPDKHERHLMPPQGARVLHAFDFGRGCPARVWFGRTPFNGLRIYASMYGQSQQLRDFAHRTIAYEVNLWGEVRSAARCFCDPSGNAEKDDGMRSVAILREFGWEPRWSGGGNEDGIEAVGDLMRAEQPDGEPMFLIDPRYNAELCRAFAGAFRRNKAGVPEREHPFIDLWDATKYGVRGTMPHKVTRRQDAPAFRVDPVSGYGRPPMPGMAPTFRDEVSA